MKENGGDGVEFTDEQLKRVAAVPMLKDLEADRLSAAPIDLEHEALEKAVGRSLPKSRPRR